MYGLETIMKMNNVTTRSRTVPENDYKEELARATMYVKFIRDANGLTHQEQNDVADMLVSAYGIEE